MSEKRLYSYDKGNNKVLCNLNDVCDFNVTNVFRLLNSLADENEQLKSLVNACEYGQKSLMKGMEKIIEEKKNDDGGFQVWEVPPIPKGSRISFTTNNDGCD